MWDKLKRYFAGRGLKEVNLRREDMLLFYTAEGDSANLVWLINDAAVATLSKESFGEFLAKIRGSFVKQGFSMIDVLTLFVTHSVEQAKAVGEDTMFWIVDEAYGRLIVYENQPEDYLGIRTMIENNLTFGGTSRNSEGAQINAWNAADAEIRYADRTKAVRMTDENRKKNYLSSLLRDKMIRNGQRSSRYQNTAVVTIALVVINVIIFLITDLFGLRKVLDAGEMSWHAVFEEHGYYRLFTCMFLHYSVDHIMGNMIALYAFGEVLERHMSRVRFTVLYLVTGLVASLVSCGWFHWFAGYDPDSAGASGAIFGLMGAMLAALIMYPQFRNRSYGMRFAVFVLYLIYTIVFAAENVNTAAHLGGLVCGLFLFPILEKIATRRRSAWKKKLR